MILNSNRERVCRWFGIALRTVYYKPLKSAPNVDPKFAESIKTMIEAPHPFGYRAAAWLLGFNKHTVQRIFQFKRWRVKKRASAFR